MSFNVERQRKFESRGDHRVGKSGMLKWIGEDIDAAGDPREDETAQVEAGTRVPELR